jgi:hypothetical protein
LRTENPDGGWLETRLWIVDDGAFSWLHGGHSNWMRNLRARPIVAIERGGETHRHRTGRRTKNMDGRESLQTVADVSMALAGFGSLLVWFCSLLPLRVFRLGPSELAAWRLASARPGGDRSCQHST